MGGASLRGTGSSIRHGFGVTDMWLFTKYGFFSVVCARQGDGGRRQPVDPHRIMIRARLRRHLEVLQSRLPDSLGGAEIVETPTTDYAFRLFVSKEDWTKAAAQLASEVDYDNFKSAVARSGDDGDGRYSESLHDVWETMHRLQKRQVSG